MHGFFNNTIPHRTSVPIFTFNAHTNLVMLHPFLFYYFKIQYSILFVLKEYLISEEKIHFPGASLFRPFSVGMINKTWKKILCFRVGK